MTPRLTTEMRVSALRRRVSAAGGSAMILAKGDAMAGALLIWAEEPGGVPMLLEHGFDGGAARVGPERGDSLAMTDYWRRRRATDPDLWVVELIVAGAERFAAEAIRTN